jgi:leucyl-tRNA synthetase
VAIPYDFRAVETRWQHRWETRGCFRAPNDPGEPRFFSYDSGPFPNGDLHLGHVRTYVLGDMTARYQRLLGKSVLYCTEWDSFGLPNELAALEQGVSPRDYTRACIKRIRSQMTRLGISYDWNRVPDTSDPAYYRWTQWLFLKMVELGLVERCETDLPWCPCCQTTLARMQVVEEACWRCTTAVVLRRTRQWAVALSRFSERLLRTLDGLVGWSPRAKNLLRGFIAGELGDSSHVRDWVVSRQRSWGTPIPLVDCSACGTVPVPEADLPVILPDDLDWSLGPRALASCDAFFETTCPACGRSARRETDTLDCYFDDIWCFLAAAAPLSSDFSFGAEAFAWMPVDRFHSGYDTFFYLHLHRFLGLVLAEQGILADGEPIGSYVGHDMVLAEGRKMSTHLGNAVAIGPLLNYPGADALRVAMLWAANPGRPVHFTDAMLERAAALLAETYTLYSACAGKVEPEDADRENEASTRTARHVRRQADAGLERVGDLIERYRPRAAVDELAGVVKLVRDYALHRVESARLSGPDRVGLAGLLRDLAIAVSPFAPHLAEECWRLLGGEPFVSLGRWPRRHA